MVAGWVQETDRWDYGEPGQGLKRVWDKEKDKYVCWERYMCAGRGTADVVCGDEGREQAETTVSAGQLITWPRKLLPYSVGAYLRFLSINSPPAHNWAWMQLEQVSSQRQRCSKDYLLCVGNELVLAPSCRSDRKERGFTSISTVLRAQSFLTKPSWPMAAVLQARQPGTCRRRHQY